MFAYCWVDKDCKYFISNIDSLELGTPLTQYQWRQFDQSENATPEYDELSNNQTKFMETYYTDRQPNMGRRKSYHSNRE